MSVPSRRQRKGQAVAGAREKNGPDVAPLWGDSERCPARTVWPPIKGTGSMSHLSPLILTVTQREKGGKSIKAGFVSCVIICPRRLGKVVICPAVFVVEKTPGADAGPGGDGRGLPRGGPTSIIPCDLATTAPFHGAELHRPPSDSTSPEEEGWQGQPETSLGRHELC